MTEKANPKVNPIVPCKKCGTPCSGTFFDPVNLEKLCINCCYALKVWKKKA